MSAGNPWKPREDGPPIPDGWTAEYTPTIMDGPVIRYHPPNGNGHDEVSASRNGVSIYWGGSARGIVAAIARAEWDHARLRNREEP